jgi:hypothetical protein
MTNEDRIATLEGQVLALQHFVGALLAQQPHHPETGLMRGNAARSCRADAKALGDVAAQSADRLADALFKAPTRPG